MISRIMNSAEGELYRAGYRVPEVRTLIRNQVLLTVALSVFLVVISGFSRWSLSFAGGALLVTVNFFSLARLVQDVIFLRAGRAVISLLFRFYARLIVTALILYAFIVWGQASVVALVAGLSMVVVNCMLWGATLALEEKV